MSAALDSLDLGDILVNTTRLEVEQLAAARQRQVESGEHLSDILVEEGMLNSDEVLIGLAAQLGIELIGELNQYAKDRGHRFGIKLTNTLVVDNQRGFMPDETMYLSGAPLHVLASCLLDKLATALPGTFMIPGHDGDIMVSFSAGVTKDNLADTLGTGLNPATICSDLLKPGGYGRMAPMLRGLAKDITAAISTFRAVWWSARSEFVHLAGDGQRALETADRICNQTLTRLSTLNGTVPADETKKTKKRAASARKSRKK